MRQIPKPYELYKHFKGDTYQVLAIAKHSETGEQMVVYQGLYGECPIYVRSLEMFMEKVDKVKYPDVKQKYRFEQVDAVAKRSEEVKAAEDVKSAEDAKAAEDTKVAEDAKVAEPAKPAEVAVNAEITEAELQIDPMVLAFLDADTYERKLEILTGLEHRITDDMITTMAVACDVEVPDGSPQERYRGLKSCLITLEKYECNRLRSEGDKTVAEQTGCFT